MSFPSIPEKEKAKAVMRLMAGAWDMIGAWAKAGVTRTRVAAVAASSASRRLRAVSMFTSSRRILAISSGRVLSGGAGSRGLTPEGSEPTCRGERRVYWPWLTRTRLQAVLILGRLD